MTEPADLRPTFHAKLVSLAEDLADACAGVARSMQVATEALLAADRAGAEQVIGHEESVDLSTTLIEDHSFDLIALQQPVASELGKVIGALRMSASVERMGDLVEHIAILTTMRHPDPVVPADLAPAFEAMGRAGAAMATQAAHAIRTLDAEVALQVILADAEVDALYESVLSGLHTDGRALRPGAEVDLTLLARYYERFADHAVSIARRVTSMATGEPYASIRRE